MMDVNTLSPRTINSSVASMAGSEAEAEILLLRTQLHQNVSAPTGATPSNSNANNSTGHVVNLGALALSKKKRRPSRDGGLRPETKPRTENDPLFELPEDYNNELNSSKQKPKTYWSGFLTVPMFVAYAILLKLQSHLREHLYISSSVLASTYAVEGGGPAASSSASNNMSSSVADVFSSSLSSSADSSSSRGGMGGEPQHQGALLLNGAASEAAYIFGLCVSFYYVGCFTFRVGHNFLLGWKLKITPRARVLFGYLGMSLSLALIVTLFFFLFDSDAVGWTSTPQAIHDHPTVLLFVLACYFIAGCSLATFEPNCLSTLTAHGPKDKVLAIGAIPLATNSVACSTLFALGLAHTASTVRSVEVGVYTAGALLCIAGALVYHFKIPRIPFEASDDDAAKFWSIVKRWREWLFDIKWLLLAAFVDECTLSLSIGIGQYIYGVKDVPMLAPFVAADSPHQHLLKHDYFLVIFFFCGFIGGTISRFMTYDLRLRNPVVYLIINATGIACILSKTPILAPVGMFCIMYGNGCIYSTMARTIDEKVGLEFNLVAYSVVACMSDIGGFTGANAVVPIHASLGSVGSGGPF